MSRLIRRASKTNFLPWLIGVPIALLAAFMSYMVLRPDPAASKFYLAQKLQIAGQSESALRVYSLIVSNMPTSSYAPLSLQQEGEILTSMARRSGDAQQYKNAIQIYQRLATEYSAHSLAGEALLAAGNIAANDLQDGKTAAGFYRTLLQNYAGNPEYVSEATLRIGRIALQNGAAKTAQYYFARVLKSYARFPERCAEAQYQSGVALETLIQNKTLARAAYEATIKKWPRSVWAASAKERLGMLLYSGSKEVRPARRVLLEIAALPEMAKSDSRSDSRMAALKILLAARGLETSESVLRGWSLLPFRAGYSPENSSRVLSEDENFETIAANAGLVFSRQSSEDSARALKALRDELDAGHAPLISLSGWVLVVGYDSSRDEILIQKPGAQRQMVDATEFAARWKKSADLSFISFHAPGETLRAAVQSKTAASPEAAPDLMAPVYLYQLPPLSLQNAHRRALRRAALLMKRTRENGVLLNLEALREISKELDALKIAPASPIPAPEILPESPDIPEDESTPQATPTPAAPDVSPPTNALTEQQSKRWKNLRSWFGAPLKNWIETRRDAAAYLEIATTDLRDARLQSAAQELQSAMTSLQNANAAIPASNAFETDAYAARQSLEVVAAKIKNAQAAEKRATAIMSAF